MIRSKSAIKLPFRQSSTNALDTVNANSRPKVESAHFLAVTNTESFIDKDRTNFEAWAFTMELSVDGTCYQEKRMYRDSDTHYAWEAWKAAIASRSAVEIMEPLQSELDRVDFEAWAITEHLDTEFRDYECVYVESDTHYAWLAWKAVFETNHEN